MQSIGKYIAAVMIATSLARPAFAGDHGRKGDYGLLDTSYIQVRLGDYATGAEAFRKLGFFVFPPREYIPGGPFVGGNIVTTDGHGVGDQLELLSLRRQECLGEAMEFMHGAEGVRSIIFHIEDYQKFHDNMRADGFGVHRPFAVDKGADFLTPRCREKLPDGGASITRFTNMYSPVVPEFGQAPVNYHTVHFRTTPREELGVYSTKIPRNPNGVIGITAVFAVSPDVETNARELAGFWERAHAMRVDGSASLDAGSFELMILTPEMATARFGADALDGEAVGLAAWPRPMIGVQFKTEDLEKLGGLLLSNGVPFRAEKDRIVVQRSWAANMVLEFIED